MEEKQSNEVEFTEGGDVQPQTDDHPMNALMEEALNFKQIEAG